jgi:hypothetical protein
MKYIKRRLNDFNVHGCSGQRRGSTASADRRSGSSSGRGTCMRAGHWDGNSPLLMCTRSHAA